MTRSRQQPARKVKLHMKWICTIRTCCNCYCTPDVGRKLTRLLCYIAICYHVIFYTCGHFPSGHGSIWDPVIPSCFLGLPQHQHVEQRNAVCSCRSQVALDNDALRNLQEMKYTPLGRALLVGTDEIAQAGMVHRARAGTSATGRSHGIQVR